MKDRFGTDWSKIKGTQFWRLPHVGRRMFFRHIASALSGYFLLPSRPADSIAKAAGTPIGTAKNCIFILLTGAPTHIDTFDLKEGPWTPSYFNPTSYGDLRFPQGLMPNIANQLGSIAFVRSVRAWATAHGIAQSWVQIGRNPASGLSKIAPHIGSVVAMELGGRPQDRTLPAFISLNASDGPGAGYFPAADAPFYVSPNGGGITNSAFPNGPEVFDRRYGMKLTIDTELEADPQLGAATDEIFQMNLEARRLMYSSQVSQVFTFDQATRVAYGNSTFGNACITARNLLRQDLGTRFVQISFGSWDHHANIYAPNATLQSMARQFDAGLGALLADLKQDGSLDQTLIVAMGEFGRTVGAVNQTGGRDHHPQQTALFAGARIRGMRAIGSTNSSGSDVADPGWSRDRVIKAEDIEATIYSALGIDWTTVRRDDPFGRGFEYVPFSGQDLYGPIHELWG